MHRIVKRLLLIAVICFVAVMSFFNRNMVINAASGTINLTATKQSIRGFGASSAWCGAINDSVMNSLYTDLGYSILRVRIEDQIGDAWKSGNYSAWANEVSNAKKASQRGAIVFASPWNPPASMQEGFTKSGDSDAKRLRYDKYAEYVQYLNAYVTNMKNNGVNLYAISVQNEPDYASDWTWWTSQEILNFMKNNAGSINCRVMAPESFQYLKNMSDPILNDAQALANLDILGCHFYGTSVSNMAYPLFQQKGAGKEVWMTEKYFDDDTIGNIMDLATEIHNAMVTGNMNAYVYWWITWANGLATSSGTIYKRAYVLGQFAKYIRPGYYRVDATANPATNVYVSAYTGDNKVVIVAINTGTASVSQSFAVQGGTVSQISSWQTTSSSNMAAGATYQASNGSFTATLPGQSITTFVGSLTNVSPTPTPNPTPTPGPISAFTQIEAESFGTQSGIQTESCGEGGENIGYIENEDYAVYNNIDFGSGAASFQARAASNTSGGNIEIRLDSITGTLVGTCSVAGTGGWQNWITGTCGVSGVSGTHNVYLKFTGGSGYLFNVNWFQFFSGSVNTPTPTSVVTPTPTSVVTPTPTSAVTPTPTSVLTPTPTSAVTPTPTSVVTPTPTSVVTPTPTPVVTPTPTPGTGNYVVLYTIQNDWGSGATVDVKIINNTGAAVNGWTLAWTFPGNQTITNIWSGTYTQSGASVTVKDAGYNANIPANGGSVNFGFNLNYSGTNAKPTSFTLNGTACEVQ